MEHILGFGEEESKESGSDVYSQPCCASSADSACSGSTNAVIMAARNSAEPMTANGVVYPPT